MSQNVTELLKADMRGEHQAIVQYLVHAYTIGDPELAAELEAIAREEMRHLDWLADAIVGLGGNPAMEREPVDFSIAPLRDQMLKDIGLEEGAIEQYRQHMEAIEDESIRRLLARIVHDEMAHRDMFQGFAEAAEANAEGGGAEAQPAALGRLGEILDEGIRHEYSVILQYLYHSFVTPDKEIMEEMQNTAINEMQHLGWLAEALTERGGDLDIEHGDLVLTRDHQEMLEADRSVEQEVTRAYSQQIPEVEDAEVRELLERIRDHEIYHDAVFGELLEEVTGEGQSSDEPAQDADKGQKEQGQAGEIPSVGSLKDA